MNKIGNDEIKRPGRPRPARPRPYSRLALEPLEDRCLPATGLTNLGELVMANAQTQKGLYEAVADPTTGFGYFATSHSGTVIKVNLNGAAAGADQRSRRPHGVGWTVRRRHRHQQRRYLPALPLYQQSNRHPLQDVARRRHSRPAGRRLALVGRTGTGRRRCLRGHRHRAAPTSPSTTPTLALATAPAAMWSACACPTSACRASKPSTVPGTLRCRDHRPRAPLPVFHRRRSDAVYPQAQPRLVSERCLLGSQPEQHNPRPGNRAARSARAYSRSGPGHRRGRQPDLRRHGDLRPCPGAAEHQHLALQSIARRPDQSRHRRPVPGQSCRGHSQSAARRARSVQRRLRPGRWRPYLRHRQHLPAMVIRVHVGNGSQADAGTREYSAPVRQLTRPCPRTAPRRPAVGGGVSASRSCSAASSTPPRVPPTSARTPIPARSSRSASARRRRPRLRTAARVGLTLPGQRQRRLGQRRHHECDFADGARPGPGRRHRCVVRRGDAARHHDSPVAPATGPSPWDRWPRVIHNLTATATNNVGTSAASAPLVVTIDTTPPAAPQFDLDATSDTAPVGDHATTLASVELTGQTEAGATVTLPQTGAHGRGRWHRHLPFPQSCPWLSAPIALSAQAADLAGNTSSFAQTITLARLPPRPRRPRTTRSSSSPAATATTRSTSCTPMARR